MEGGFQKVPLARVFRIDEFENVEDKRLVDVSFRKVGVEIGTLEESEEEFVHDLEMGPGQLEDWLVFFRVKGVSARVNTRGDGAEKIGGELGSWSVKLEGYSIGLTILTTSG